ncbi:TyeA family type III secretion system gatekeeper subunit [Providencia hangzhouensis]|uniref:TyeA family type III secretion system gatekeeper subunit n=1 Tax=Providencia hangzhouensis TaxID=3031799 RepID=UPI0034DD94B7
MTMVQVFMFMIIAKCVAQLFPRIMSVVTSYSIMSSDIRGQFLQLLLLAFSIIPVTVFPSLEAREELIDQLKKLMDQVMVKEPFLHRHS